MCCARADAHVPVYQHRKQQARLWHVCDPPIEYHQAPDAACAVHAQTLIAAYDMAGRPEAAEAVFAFAARASLGA